MEAPEARRLKLLAKSILRAHPDVPYAPEAFELVLEGMQHAMEGIHRCEGDVRHVTGQELSLHLRDYTRWAYGPLARMVLAEWGLNCTRDFGEIVYLLIDAKYLRCTDDDRIEDFDGVYDFKTAFRFPWRTA